MRTRRARRRRRGIVFALWIGFHIGGRQVSRDFDDLVTALCAFLACMMCWRAREVQDRRLHRFWSLMALATLAWTVAEVIWGVYDAILRVAPPVPSWADVGYLSAIPLTVAALLCHPAMHARHGRDARLVTRTILDGVIVAMAILFLSWSFVLGPLWRHTDLSTLGGIVTVAYPFGDVVMLFLVVLVTTASRRGDRLALWCVLGGLTAMALSDSTYSYLVETGHYHSGNLIDAGWVVAYLGLALGGFAASHDGPVRVVTKDETRVLSVVISLLPILCALVASGLEVLVGRKLLWSDWVMAFALAVLFLGRQALQLFGTLPEEDSSRPPDLDAQLVALTVPSKSAAPIRDEGIDR